MALTPFWILAVFCFRGFNLLKPIQLAGINAGRLGHLVMDVEMFLAEREIGVQGYRNNIIDLRYIWTAGLPVSNRLILELWRPFFTIGPRWILEPVNQWNHRIPGGRTTKIPWRKGEELNQHNDRYGALARTPPHLPITKEHENLAITTLARIRPGFSLDKPYVCIHVRDSSYFKKHQPGNRDDTTRDAQIADYESAIRLLISEGIQVVRMGAVVRDSLNLHDNRVWDYASDGSRCELLDVVLPSKCAFFISTLSGPDKIAQMFRRPILFTNIPLKSIPFWMTHSLIVPKRLYRDNGTWVPWQEAYASGMYLLSESELRRQGVHLVNNLESEIQMATREMLDRLSGNSMDDVRSEIQWDSLIKHVPDYLKAGGVRAKFAKVML